MKVKELQEKLQRVNPEAEVEVIVNNYPQKFTLVHGGSEGCTEKNCRDWGFYVDDMCDSEREG